jgi:hypothetical protein
MKFIVTSLISALACQALRIIQSNDDGWAELYLRALNDELLRAGHTVILSAPADNKSGSSTLCPYLHLNHDAAERTQL